MTQDTRPVWPFALPLAEFNKINSVWITEVAKCSRMTGSDTAEYWIEFRSNADDEIKVRSTPALWELFEFDRHHHAKLITLTHTGERAEKLAGEIKAFDKKHNAEIATYKRLKAKYEGTDI